MSKAIKTDGYHTCARCRWKKTEWNRNELSFDMQQYSNSIWTLRAKDEIERERRKFPGKTRIAHGTRAKHHFSAYAPANLGRDQQHLGRTVWQYIRCTVGFKKKEPLTEFRHHRMPEGHTLECEEQLVIGKNVPGSRNTIEDGDYSHLVDCGGGRRESRIYERWWKCKKQNVFFFRSSEFYGSYVCVLGTITLM